MAVKVVHLDDVPVVVVRRTRPPRRTIARTMEETEIKEGRMTTEKYECIYCGQKFTYAVELMEHVEEKHQQKID